MATVISLSPKQACCYIDYNSNLDCTKKTDNAYKINLSQQSPDGDNINTNKSSYDANTDIATLPLCKTHANLLNLTA